MRVELEFEVSIGGRRVEGFDPEECTGIGAFMSLSPSEAGAKGWDEPDMEG